MSWIKIHRSINDWEWKRRPLTVALWVHILANVNYKETRYEGHIIPIGSMVAGVHSLSEKTGLSVQQVRTALSHLKKQEVTIKTTNKFSIISVVKWDEYQEDNKQITNKQQTTNKQLTTSKEGKNKRNNINIIPACVSDDVWDDFKRLRSQKKAPITKTALDRIEAEAKKAGWGLEDALREMCARGWTGFKAEWILKGDKHENFRGSIKPSKSELARKAAYEGYCATTGKT